MQEKNNSLNRAIGICTGACSISVVEIEKVNGEIKILKHETVEHNGDPKSILTKYLDEIIDKKCYLGVTGRKFRRLTNCHSITEPEAVEYALEYVSRDGRKYDAVVSAGGETFIVYEIDKKGKISRVSSGNKCASGTGEFFMQQIRRMNVSLEEAMRLSRESKHPHHLSGRCSVFCKSDCTHALNKGESIGDVAAGLSRMIAKKIEELLIKVKADNILIVGGVAKNDVVINFVKEAVKNVYVPAEAHYFEALGAAIWALNTKQENNLVKGAYFRAQKPSFETLKPLANFKHLVEFKEMPFEKAKDGDECIIGLDVGSTTTKAILLRVEDDKILASVYLRTNGNPILASRQCYKSLYEQIKGINVKIIGLGVTGSGRYISGIHADTKGIINEIIAHARASAHFDKDVDTIFEIGGQDAKYTFLTNSVASDYAMNEACSAGTGSFLEESAYESLGVKMEEIEPIALSAKHPPNFSDQCAAFISSDIMTAFQEGISKEDIIAGLVYSICINYVNRVKGSRQVGKKIFMQGGVCYNKAVPIAMAALTGKHIIVPPHPGLMGAYGVALEIKNMLCLGLLDKQEFDLLDLSNREVEYGNNFICPGKPENCDRKCEISVIKVKGKTFPFGGACNKYYNQIRHIQFKGEDYNHVTKRMELLYHAFTKPNPNLKPDAITIGINRSFEVNTLYPLFYNFFTELGCRVILPDFAEQSGIDKGMTSYCLSGQISLGMFENLLKKNPDYVFIPSITEMHVSKQEKYRKQYQTTCMFVEGEPTYLKATFLRDKDKPKILSPYFNFMEGFDSEEKKFIEIAKELGFSEEEGRRAHKIAFERQCEFFKAMKEEGRRILKKLESEPDRFAVVLFGRPYNAFADETNKGVPSKFSSRGIEIIPYDFLEYEQEENFRNVFWEMGLRIIKAARIVKRHPQLFGCYLTNFLCALDSIMVPHFRDLMGTKPSLTIEVDSHTADAGVNTRIEAFLDVIKNYIKIRDKIREPQINFNVAHTMIDSKGRAWFIDSEGKKHAIINNPDVKVVLPSMGDLFNRSMAAVLQGLGWNAEALPRCDREALDLGRSVLTGKECLPVINIVGEVLKYLKYRKNPDEKLAVFLVSAGGGCRVGQYQVLLRTVIEKMGLKNVAIITLGNDDGYLGLGIKFRINACKALYTSDILEDIRNAILAMAVDKEKGMQIFEAETQKILDCISGKSKIPFFKQIRNTVNEFKKIKLTKPISEAKYIGIVGEIFVRRDHFCLQFLPERLAEHGFVTLSAPVAEWVRYTDFLRKTKMFVPKEDIKRNLRARIEDMLSEFIQDYYEVRLKKMFAETGLYEFEKIDVYHYISHATHLFPPTLIGEPGLSSGASLAHLADKYCGVLNVGPFGCMNSRITEAVATIEMTVEGKVKAAKVANRKIDISHIQDSTDILPFLSIEFDGNPLSQIIEARLETFMLQANRLYEKMMEKKKKEKQK